MEHSNSNKKQSEFSVLEIIKSSQNKHGLRHTDYEAYRAHCSNKLKRLTRKMQLKVKSKKPTRFQDYFSYPPPLEPLSNSLFQKYLAGYLFQSERAWAMAQSLKSEALNQPRKKFHFIKRLKKARLCSKRLSQLALNEHYKTRLSLSSHLQIQGYAFWMAAQYFIEIRDWTEAINCLVLSSQCYKKTLPLVPSQSLLQEKIEQNQVLLKFVCYQLEITLPTSNPELEKVLQGFKHEEDQKNIDALVDQFGSNLKLVSSSSKENSEHSGKDIYWTNGLVLKYSDFPQIISALNSSVNFDFLQEESSQWKTKSLKLVESMVFIKNNLLTNTGSNAQDLQILTSFIQLSTENSQIAYCLSQAFENNVFYSELVSNQPPNCRQRLDFLWLQKSLLNKTLQSLKNLCIVPVLKDDSLFTKTSQVRIELFESEKLLLEAIKKYYKKTPVGSLSSLRETFERLKTQYSLYDSVLKSYCPTKDLERDRLEFLTLKLTQFSRLVSQEDHERKDLEQKNEDLVEQKDFSEPRETKSGLSGFIKHWWNKSTTSLK